MLEETVSAGLSALGIGFDDTVLKRLRIYYDYLSEMNAVMNLTAIKGEEDTARLHFTDCAAILTMADFQDKKVLDMGTGAGFPGMVLKILRPGMDICLMDSLDKRISFLRNLGDKLGLEGVEYIHMRAEEAPQAYREAYDIVLSRAVARLNLLAELCLPFVKNGGLFIAMKGPGGKEELDEAAHGIKLLGGKYEKTVSYPIPGTDRKHNALLIRKAAPTPGKYPRRWAQMKKQPL